MKPLPLTTLRNGEAISLKQVAVAAIPKLRDHIIAAVATGQRLAAFFGMRCGRRTVRLFALLADDPKGVVNLLCADAKEAFPSLTPDCPQAHLFEREIYEQFGLLPEGHPWLKPVRFAAADYPIQATLTAPTIGQTNFFKMQGEEVHEVAVGPVHAGVIEPGHFRFQCHGEKVYHLEISLGYQHRGIEKALINGPHQRTRYQLETVAGDTSIGHGLAYATVM